MDIEGELAIYRRAVIQTDATLRRARQHKSLGIVKPSDLAIRILTYCIPRHYDSLKIRRWFGIHNKQVWIQFILGYRTFDDTKLIEMDTLLRKLCS